MPNMGIVSYDKKLSAFLFSKTRRGLLSLLYGRSDETFYVNQLMQSTGGGSGAVQRELRLMTEAGIVLRTRTGNMVYYQANKNCPVYDELRSIVSKTFGLADVLREALTPLSGKIDGAFVYGSMASGEATAKSDIDLLVVGRVDETALHKAITGAEDRLARPVNYTLMSKREFSKRKKGKEGFLARVLSGPRIIILGDFDGI